MKISELIALLEQRKEEFGDFDVLYKDSCSGFYRPKEAEDFRVSFSPYTIEHYHIVQGYQMFVD